MASNGMEERMKELQRKMAAKRGGFMKLELGRNVIRVCPSWRGEDEDYYIHLPTHYNVGATPQTPRTGETVLCLEYFGESCPVEEAIDFWTNSRKPASMQKGEALRNQTKQRIAFNALTDNDPEGTIRPLSVSYSPVFTDMMALWMESGDFTDPKHGYQLCITGTKRVNTTIIDYKVIAVGRDSSPIGKADWSAHLVNLDQFAERSRRSRQEIVGFLKGAEREREAF